MSEGSAKIWDPEWVTNDHRQAWMAQRFQLGMLLRQSGNNDAAVISTLLDLVPRERFVARSFLAQAYDNLALPAGEGQTISAPEVVCQMTSALELSAEQRVLEVGTGSGYQAAVLSHLVHDVFSIERFDTLAQTAQSRLSLLGRENVRQFVGDGTQGLPALAPFDRIILTAAPEQIPPGLFDQLALDGILVAPVGRQNQAQHLVRCRKTAVGIQTEVLGKVRFVPLVASMPQR